MLFYLILNGVLDLNAEAGAKCNQIEQQGNVMRIFCYRIQYITDFNVNSDIEFVYESGDTYRQFTQIFIDTKLIKNQKISTVLSSKESVNFLSLCMVDSDVKIEDSQIFVTVSKQTSVYYTELIVSAREVKILGSELQFTSAASLFFGGIIADLYQSLEVNSTDVDFKLITGDVGGGLVGYSVMFATINIMNLTAQLVLTANMGFKNVLGSIVATTGVGMTLDINSSVIKSSLKAHLYEHVGSIIGNAFNKEVVVNIVNSTFCVKGKYTKDGCATGTCTVNRVDSTGPVCK
ncbi:Hypothetical_protein [Hexamita inflata]|uniref:Hypothetical_protein n=1 Tax=Hexamita inflata TaxID=28002 RepID=A0AA86QKA3_9EUKA|nr:Hypothetical protein HINF_LOCUS43598 [Hexamita inflata]